MRAGNPIQSVYSCGTARRPFGDCSDSVRTRFGRNDYGMFRSCLQILREIQQVFPGLGKN